MTREQKLLARMRKFRGFTLEDSSTEMTLEESQRLEDLCERLDSAKDEGKLDQGTIDLVHDVLVEIKPAVDEAKGAECPVVAGGIKYLEYLGARSTSPGES